MMLYRQAIRRTVVSHAPTRHLSVSWPRLLDTNRSTAAPPDDAPPPSTSTGSPHHAPRNQSADAKPFPISPPPSDARIARRKITSMDQLPASFGRNQIIHVPEDVQRDLEDVLHTFKAPIRHAFAYGSGVFRQAGYKKEDKPLLDFVFAVSHPSHWHAINMQQNPHHYSMPMRLMGSDAVAWMQDKGLGASVWFNVEVDINGKVVKYGVISVDALCRDLLDWETLYISGRTQKPVRILQDDARVRLANQVNLASAMRTALLLLPEEFTEVQLFEEIAGLSYRGDFRMKVGENPLKVRNIVSAQLEEFQSLYGGLLKSFWKTVYVIGEAPYEGKSVRLIRQDKSTKQRASIASKLPIGLKSKLRGHYEAKWNLQRALATTSTGNSSDKRADEGEQQHAVDLEQAVMWEKIVSDGEFLDVLDASIQQIVRRPTFNQSLKGILSAGPVKSLRYIGPKLRKKWFSPGPVSAPTVEPEDIRPAILDQQSSSSSSSSKTKSSP